MKRLPKGSSEPLILKSLLGGSKSVRDIERATKLKKPTLYLSLNKLKRKGLIKALGTRRSRRWALTPRGRSLVNRRIKAERILKVVIDPLRRAMSLGVTMPEIERLVSRGK